MAMNSKRKKMGRGPNIKEAIVTEIIRIKATPDNPSASKVLEELKQRHPNSKSIPSLRAIGGIIKRHTDEIAAMRSDKELSLWSLADLDQMEVPPDSIPAVLALLKLRRDNHKELTRRDVKWAARLYPIIVGLNDGKAPPEIISWIDGWVKLYSDLETIAKTVKGLGYGTEWQDLQLLESKGCFSDKFSMSPEYKEQVTNGLKKYVGGKQK
jgi:hypothetical protein